MVMYPAIVDVQLEAGEAGFIGVLFLAAIATTGYIHHLQAELKKQQQQLDEQAEFNKKLNATVDRMLKIDDAGAIDSNRRKRGK